MKKIMLYTATVISLALASCDEEVEPLIDSGATRILQFEKSEFQLSENSAEISVSVVFDNPSQAAVGFLELEIISLHSNTFDVLPAVKNGKIELPINKGSSSLSFKIKPVNNDVIDDNREIIIRMNKASSGFILGAINQAKITITDDENAARINFTSAQSLTFEDDADGSVIDLQLSKSCPDNGEVEILLTSDDAVYGEHYTTYPESIGGKISMPLSAGTEKTQIKIIPINNSRVHGTRHLALTISSTSGGIISGELDEHGVTIQDDELGGISKSYTLSGNNWSSKRFFGYTEDGLISKIYWEQNTPGSTSGTYNYHYNGNKQLVKLTESDMSEIQYIHENGRIVKSEKFNAGSMTQYTLYGYDDAGNVGEALIYYRQPTGDFKAGLHFVYLYFHDGNLYKQLTYDPANENEPVLISTRTYEDYIPSSNQFPIEIIPNKIAQPNLPLKYSVEENGQLLQYTFEYEFDSQGRARKRTTRSSMGGTEEAKYDFY